jgi:histidinol phosphatase-like PHP family hydrolase
MGRVRASGAATARRPSAFAPLPLRNRQIAELLASEGEKAEGYVRKAFFRAAHAAFLWPEEAARMLAENRSLTELTAVGPFLAKTISKWIESPPEESPALPEVRRNFITLTEAHEMLASHPGWREKLKGDLQMHSRWSDGSASIAEMAEAGIARGYQYLSITDHTKALKIAGGIDENQLETQAEEIASLNAELRKPGRRFQVLRSVELNLSPTGTGDMDPAALARLDIVLGSFHSQLRKTTDQTERYIAALNNPDIQILGHPRGRVYNYRLGLGADWARVFAQAAALDKAVEIDAYPDRQDLDVELLQLARETGVRISLGSDAHHPWQLMFLDLGLAAALLARIPEDRIVNFMPVDELLAWVRRVRSG